MATKGKLMRSRDACLGGVCGGIASYCGIDPVIVRILTVVLACASWGVVVVAYGALWAVLPKEPPVVDSPVEVSPDQVESATYGTVPNDVACGKACGGSVRAYRAEAAAGSGHVPPPPPDCCGAARPRDEAPAAAMKPDARVDDSIITPSLLMGFALLTVALSGILAMLVQGVSWWQFWPLFLIEIAIARMVLPSRCSSAAERIVEGVMLFSFSVVILALSLGVASWATLPAMLAGGWPLLAAAIGLLVISGKRKSTLCLAFACACFVVFCLAGFAAFAVPGPLGSLVVSMPFCPQHSFFFGTLS